MNWFFSVWKKLFQKKPKIGEIKISVMSSPEDNGEVFRRAFVEYPFYEFGRVVNFGTIFGISVNPGWTTEEEMAGFKKVLMAVASKFKFKKHDLEQLLTCHSIVFYPKPDPFPLSYSNTRFIRDVEVYAAVMMRNLTPGHLTCPTGIYELTGDVVKEGISSVDSSYGLAISSVIGDAILNGPGFPDRSDTVASALAKTKFMNIAIQHLHETVDDALVTDIPTGIVTCYRKFISGYRYIGHWP